MQLLMGTVVDSVTSAGRRARTESPIIHRIGYHDRALDIRRGTLNSRALMLRLGTDFPSLVEPYHVSEMALASMIQGEKEE